MTDINSRVALLAVVTMSVAAVLVFALLPVITGAAADRFDLEASEVGLVAFYYFGPYALVSATAPFWISRTSWRRVRDIAYVAMLLGLLLAVSTETFQFFALGLVGLAIGAALLYPVCMTATALMTNPSRIFAIRLMAEQLVPAGLLIVFTLTLGSVIDLTTLLVVMAGLILITALLALGMPPGDVEALGQRGETAGEGSVKPAPLIALAINFAGYAALWAFFERIGVDRAYPGEFILLWISVGLVTAGLGPLLAVVLQRWLADPVIGVLCLVLMVICMGLLSLQPEQCIYALALAVLPFCYGVLLVLLLANAAAADVAGKTAALIPFSLAVGAAVGPLLFGYLWALSAPVILISAAAIAAGALWLLLRERPKNSLMDAN